MNTDIYILGAGGMAREAYQIYKDKGIDTLVKAFVISNNIRETSKKIYGLPIITDSDLPKNKNSVLLSPAIGNPLRREWIRKLEASKYQFNTLVHPSGLIGKDVRLGNGSIVCAYSVLTCNIVLGPYSIINTHSTIHHDCKIGAFSTISSGVMIGGNVTIGEGVFVGVGTSIIEKVRVGNNTFIGAGSVVVNNIPSNVLAYGNPAKPVRKITKSDWETLI